MFAVMHRKGNMKYKHAAALVAVVATTISLAAVGEKKEAAPKVYLLKAGRKTIAELRVQPSATFTVENTSPSGRSEYDVSTGKIVATGGAILQLTIGTNSISVRADEIESVPGSQ
jgi:hypothetical protein